MARAGNPGVGREVLQQAANAVEVHPSKLEAARALGIGRGCLENRLRRAADLGIKADTAGTDPVKLAQRERIALQDRVRDLQNQITAMHREQLTEDKIRDKIFGLATAQLSPPLWAAQSGKKADGPGIPSVLWSDWHWGEVVKPAQVNGVNKFDLGVAKERLKRLVSRVIALCFDHMVSPNYPGIVVNLGGDMVSGDIHEELTETNELPSGPILLDATECLIWALDTLADKFGRIWVVGVSGNHGRMTKRPRFKDRQFTNFDWVIYHLLRMHFTKDKRFSFLIPDGADAHYQVLGRRYLLTHGDNLGVKGGDGIIGSLGPIRRGDVKMRNASGAIGRGYDTILMGHWHQYMALLDLVVNGSLKGFDEFAHLALRARPEPPIQALWFTHERYGITAQWPVFCEINTERWAGDAVSWRAA